MMTRIRLDPTDSRPIWRQIEIGIQHLVAAGTLEIGSPIPSVRQMARELRVNPATVSKAYQRLVDQRVLIVRRGEGTFVAETSPDTPQASRRHLLEDAAARYAGLAGALGCDRSEVVQALASAWEELQRGKGGER